MDTPQLAAHTANISRAYLEALTDILGIGHFAPDDILFLKVIENRVFEIAKRAGMQLDEFSEQRRAEGMKRFGTAENRRLSRRAIRSEGEGDNGSQAPESVSNETSGFDFGRAGSDNPFRTGSVSADDSGSAEGDAVEGFENASVGRVRGRRNITAEPYKPTEKEANFGLKTEE